MPGDYVVTTNYFGGQQVSSLTGPTTLLLSIFTNYGRPNQVGVAFFPFLDIHNEKIAVTWSRRPRI